MAIYMKQEIEKRLQAALEPSMCEVVDESALHAGHAGARPGGNTHFRLKIVSAAFKGLSRVQRHQLVYQVLADLMNNPIHALALELSDGK